VWWCNPVIPVLGRIKLEVYEFEASLGSSQMKQKQQKKEEYCT
jgi:hypothetical protein